MAGLGSRFLNSHPHELKPMIKIKDKFMIEMVIENLNQSKDIQFIFVVLKSFLKDKRFLDLLKNLKIKYKIICLKNKTDGPARTALFAKKYIKNKKLLIVNCDQIMVDFNLENFLFFCKLNKVDGALGVFHSNESKHSYVKLGEDLKIQEIKEKIVISNLASTGLYFWENGDDFIESCSKMIKFKDKYFKEYYVAPSFNYLIKEGKRIFPYHINLHFPIGTPQDLDLYMNNLNENR